MAEQLDSLLAYSKVDFDPLIALLESAFTIKEHFVIIDGIDECSREAQLTMFKILGDLQNSVAHFKVFLSIRENLTQTVEENISVTFMVSTESAGAAKALSTYIDLSVDLAYERRDLETRNKNLLNGIKDALKRGAHGMLANLIYLHSI